MKNLNDYTPAINVVDSEEKLKAITPVKIKTNDCS